MLESHCSRDAISGRVAGLQNERGIAKVERIVVVVSIKYILCEEINLEMFVRVTCLGIDQKVGVLGGGAAGDVVGVVQVVASHANDLAVKVKMPPGQTIVRRDVGGEFRHEADRF